MERKYSTSSSFAIERKNSKEQEISFFLCLHLYLQKYIILRGGATGALAEEQAEIIFASLRPYRSCCTISLVCHTKHVKTFYLQLYVSHQACENFLPPTRSVTPTMAKTFCVQLYYRQHQACEIVLPPTLSVTPSMRKLFTSNSICHTNHAKTFYLQTSLHLFTSTALVSLLK